MSVWSAPDSFFNTGSLNPAVLLNVRTNAHQSAAVNPLENNEGHAVGMCECEWTHWPHYAAIISHTHT